MKILLLALLWTTASLKAIPQYAISGATHQNSRSSSAGCPPISINSTAAKTGRKAWDKCIEYQALNFPCTSVTSTSKQVRVNLCQSKVDDLIMRDHARPNEFPHAVILGYGEDESKLEWQCLGTLVSDWFVVISAHCAFNRDFGNVTHVNLNGGTLTAQLDPQRTYRVEQVIRHPMFKPPKFYNDIALLKMEKQIRLDERAVPACIYTGDEPQNDKPTGLNLDLDIIKEGKYFDKLLQRVLLSKSSTEECVKAYPPTRRLRDGYDEETQVCYSERNSNCRSNIGTVQSYSRRIHCMFWLIGVSNIGKGCGHDKPELHTRVEKYAPWIESIVWP